MYSFPALYITFFKIVKKNCWISHFLLKVYSVFVTPGCAGPAVCQIIS